MAAYVRVVHPVLHVCHTIGTRVPCGAPLNVHTVLAPQPCHLDHWMHPTPIRTATGGPNSLHQPLTVYPPMYAHPHAAAPAPTRTHAHASTAVMRPKCTRRRPHARTHMRHGEICSRTRTVSPLIRTINASGRVSNPRRNDNQPEFGFGFTPAVSGSTVVANGHSPFRHYACALHQHTAPLALRCLFGTLRVAKFSPRQSIQYLRTEPHRCATTAPRFSVTVFFFHLFSFFLLLCHRAQHDQLTLPAPPPTMSLCYLFLTTLHF